MIDSSKAKAIAVEVQAAILALKAHLPENLNGELAPEVVDDLTIAVFAITDVAQKLPKLMRELRSSSGYYQSASNTKPEYARRKPSSSSVSINVNPTPWISSTSTNSLTLTNSLAE